LEIFKKNKVIDDWGTVYIGLKFQWITLSEIINYCKTGTINCSNERLSLLREASNESLFKFLELIRNFIIEDGHPQIKWNEDSLTDNLSAVPQQYFNIWELEFLLRIVNSLETNEKKLHLVAAIHSDFNYPVSWHNFLYFMPAPNGNPIGIEGLYKNLLSYIDAKLNELKSL
jgi:hypothetical protein